MCLRSPSGGVLRIASSDLAAPPDGTAAAAPGWVRVIVGDSGSGMDETTLARVFEPFFTTKADGKSTGLGLTMVYTAITGLGGQVRIDSAPGRGTTVILDLPRRDLPSSERDPSGPHPASRASCILVVDDEPSALAVAREALAADGHEVITATDGIAGAEAFAAAADRIDVVVLDMMMPRCDGRGCLATIRVRRPGVPAILVSGFIGDPESAAGFDAVLRKPYRISDLSQAVARLLASRG